eukprot:6617455-Alexandrium_andersonii.AAC.1
MHYSHSGDPSDFKAFGARTTLKAPRPFKPPKGSRSVHSDLMGHTQELLYHRLLWGPSQSSGGRTSSRSW